MTTLRVLWITNDLPPRAGGIEQFIGNLLRRGPDDAVVVGPANDEGPAWDATVPWEVVRLPGRVLPTPATRRRIAEVAARCRPDVVVLGAMWPLGELARWLDREVAPVVALSHGHEAGLVSARLGPLVRRATRGITALTTISDYTEDLLRPWSSAAEVVRVPPGVDVGAFHPDLDGRHLRRAWGVPEDATVVGCLSRLVERKGQDVLLEAWPRLAARHPEAWLVLAGVGPLAAELREAAGRLGPDARVVLPGRVPWEDLPSAYAAFDAFAMPCRTRLGGLDVEGLGIVYLEAQAVGVPVVAGRSGGAPETVRDGETGLVVDGTSVDHVADAVDRLLADAALRRRMGAAGREHAVDHWSWDVIAARFDEVLRGAAGRRST